MGSEYIKAVILGVIQGVTEFLPVSSKGHLVILREPLDRWLHIHSEEADNLQLFIALHLGTLVSILWFYRADLLRMRLRMGAAVVLATLPLVAAALVFKQKLEFAYSVPLWAGFGLLATAVILFLGQRIPLGNITLEELSLRNALYAGVFQMLAILPGVSRSGTTIVGGSLSGLQREAAANFSFLIAIPAICGAAVLMGHDILQGHGGGNAASVMLVGALTSFVVGLAAIRWLLRMIVIGRLHWFAWYCAATGLATITWQLWEWASHSTTG